MSVQACAEIVKQGDPDRFLAVMAAPPAARGALFPIYAFNVEVARAPWMTKEPMIAEMRLQWWRDALAEIATGGIVRRHEVIVPLAHVLDAESAGWLDHLVAARRWDIDSAPFESDAAFDTYLADTGGWLMAVAAHALGDRAAEGARALGAAAGFANYLMAVSALIAAGKQPLPEGAEHWIEEMSDKYLKMFHINRKGHSAGLRHAALSAWRTKGVLTQARRDPQAVLEGRLGGSEFARRMGLLRTQMLGL